jgi:elongation factor P
VIQASEFRKGTKFLYKNEPHVVVDFQHVKPGKGGAFMRTKMKNMITGSTYEETFRSEEKFPTPDLQYKQMQFLYADSQDYNFMDQESYDQVVFTKDQLDTVINYLKEQEVYDVLYFQSRPIAVNAPMFLNLVVTETPPGVKGNTAQGGATKPATMETGLVLQVPLFVNEGDVLKVDTREGVYVERLKV